MADSPKRRPGRPPGTGKHNYPGGHAPQVLVRLPPELMAWVKSKGGAAYLRQLAEQARAQDQTEEG